MKKLLLFSVASLFTLTANAEVWDLTKWSAETVANLKADAATWEIKTASITNEDLSTETIDYRASNLDKTPINLIANGVEIAELKGINIDLTAKTPKDKLRLDFAGTNPGVKFNTKDVTFTVANCVPGEKIGIVFASNGTESRGFSSITGATWDSEEAPMTDNVKAFATATITGSEVTFAITGGIGIFRIETGEKVTSSISGIEAEESVIKTEYYNIAGQKVATPNGVTIRKETMSNGKINISKIVK